MAEMSFAQAMAETVDCARVSGHCYYLYKSKSQGWLIAAHYWDDWLFKAYPGGRKQLSVRGAEMSGAAQHQLERTATPDPRQEVDQELYALVQRLYGK